jgi:hypothetical protein
MMPAKWSARGPHMSFKVIDGDGPGEEARDLERDREWAKHEFSWAIRDTAANTLRIIRGAGKPYELLLQMKKAIDSAIKFQDLHGHLPSDIIANDLRVEDEEETFLARAREGKINQTSIDLWREDGTFDRMSAENTMYRGALQAIASELIGQATQKRSGESEFHDGLREWMKIREERIRKDREAARASRPSPRKMKLRKPNKPV